MTAMTLRQDAVADIWQELQPLIKTTIRRAKLFCLTEDEAMSIAAEAVIVAVDTFDACKECTATTWITQRVFYALKEAQRTLLARRRLFADNVQPSRDEYEHTEFRLVDIAASLSTDAEAMLRLMYQDEIILAAIARLRTPKSIQASIAARFQDIGWGAAKITACLLEISRAVRA